MTDTPVPAFEHPRTADEWWEQAAYVRSVMHEWGPNNQPMNALFKANESLAIRHFGKSLVAYAEQHPTEGLYDALDKFIAERNGRLAWRVFEGVWSEAPDAPYIHSWIGWGRLCDLCSESYLVVKEPA